MCSTAGQSNRQIQRRHAWQCKVIEALESRRFLNASASYHLTYDDEFNSLKLSNYNSSGNLVNTDPANSGYLTRDGYGSSGYDGTAGGPLQYYANPATDSYNPFSTSNGILSITAQPTPTDANGAPSVDTQAPYVSGELTTAQGESNEPYNQSDGFAQQYGYFEIRCEIPQGTGLWPAFWLYSEPNLNKTQNTSEYDIFEIPQSSDPTVNENSSTIYQVSHLNSGFEEGAYTLPAGQDASTSYHTYGFEWDSNSIRWYVDGVLTQTQANVSNTPMYILMDLAVGGAFPGSPNSGTSFPAGFNIDYLRAYSNSASAPEVAEQPGYSLNPDTTDAIAVVPEPAATTPSLVVNTTQDLATPVAGLTSLRQAVEGAQELGGNQTITFAPSLAGQTVDLDIDADDTFGPSALGINSSITIDGGSSGITITRDTTVAASGLRLFYVTPAGSLTLDDVTLSDGLAAGGNSGSGGGAAGLGGAIVNAGSLSVENSTLVGNTALGGSTGGGTSVLGGGGLLSAGDAINGGSPGGGGQNAGGGFGGGGGEGGTGGFGGGGGAYAEGGFGGGGGLDNNGGFAAGAAGNTGGGGAGLGGAVFNYGGTLLLMNATFYNDSAVGGTGGSGSDGGGKGSGLGGAVFNLNGTVNAAFATINGNTADQGSSIYSLGDNGIATQGGPGLPPNPATVKLTDSILSDFVQATHASDGQAFGTVSASGTDNLVQSTAVTGLGVVSANSPLLSVPALYGGATPTFALLPGSPAIGAGVSLLGTTMDQRGNARPATPDIGAYQSEGFVITATGGASQSTGVGKAFGTSLAVRVVSNNALLTDLAGGVISFIAPASGASATFTANPITLAANGTGSATATANSIAGGPYAVSASASGIASAASFALTNTAAAAITPTVQVSDPGGAYTGLHFAATGSVTGTGGATIATPTFKYYLASDTTFSNPFAAGAPTTVGSYVVVASFAGNATYSAASKSANFSITKATPTVIVTDAGGAYNGSAFPASATVNGLASLEGVKPTFSYYIGSSVSGTSTATAPTAAGTYTVVASFPGSVAYLTASSKAITFTITAAVPVGQFIGTASSNTAGSMNSLGNTFANAVDGDVNTFFDAPAANGNWVQLDLGSARTITKLAYAPRVASGGVSYESRMSGGIFQASNSATFSSSVLTLYTITAPPADGITTQAVSVSGTYRYVRYVSPNGSYGNIGEMQVFGPGGNATTKVLAPLSGTASANTTGSFNNSGNTFAKAFDGNVNSFFDAPSANGDWIQLDLGAAKTLTELAYAPRTFNNESRMIGGIFEASNSASFSSGVVTLYTVTTKPTDGLVTRMLSLSGTYRYVRYVAPNASYGDIAEMQVFGH